MLAFERWKNAADFCVWYMFLNVWILSAIVTWKFVGSSWSVPLSKL
jgi:hypothetical protein